MAVAAETRLCVLVLVEARDQASVRDHHRHLHMQAVHFMALIIFQLGRGQAVVHRHLHTNRVLAPALPVLLGEPVAPVFDDSDGEAVIVDRLPGDVVACRVLKRNRVVLKGVQVTAGFCQQLLLLG